MYYLQGSLHPIEGPTPGPGPNSLQEQIDSIEELKFVELKPGQKFVLKHLLQFLIDQKQFDSMEDKARLKLRESAIDHFETTETGKILNIVDRAIAYVSSNDSSYENPDFNLEYLSEFREKLIKTIEEDK